MRRHIRSRWAREDLLAVGRALDGAGQRGPDLGEEAQRQRVAGVALGERAVRDAVAFAGPRGLLAPEVADAYGVREAGQRRRVQGARRVVGAGLLPVLGAAGDDHARPGAGEPGRGRRPSTAEAVGEDVAASPRGRRAGRAAAARRRAPGVPPARGWPRPDAGAGGGGDDRAPAWWQRAGDGVGQTRCRRPAGRRRAARAWARVRRPGPAGGERGEFGGASGPGVARRGRAPGPGRRGRRRTPERRRPVRPGPARRRARWPSRRRWR